VLLNFLRQKRLSNPDPFAWLDLPEISSTGLTERKHYPLRGMPLVIADDFDEPMSDLWDALGT